MQRQELQRDLLTQFGQVVRSKRPAGARFAAPGPEHTKEFTNLKQAADDAKTADEAIDKLGMTTEQLNQQVTGTSEGFSAFIQRLKDSGNGGEQAAGHFQEASH